MELTHLWGPAKLPSAMQTIPRPLRVLPVLVIAAAGACSDTTALPPVQYDNVLDTTFLAALTGTAIGSPSAFDGVAAETARTDLNEPFDFAVDLDDAGAVLLYPAGALGFAPDPGVLVERRAFDDVRSAPTDGYVQDSVVTATVGTVFVLRSRLSTQQCSSGALPRYAKFQVLAIDQQSRTVTLEFLANLNCGYRGLEPGTPTD